MGARATRFQAGAPRPRVAWATGALFAHSPSQSWRLHFPRPRAVSRTSCRPRSRPSMRRRRWSRFRRRRRLCSSRVTLTQPGRAVAGGLHGFAPGLGRRLEILRRSLLTQSMILGPRRAATKEVTLIAQAGRPDVVRRVDVEVLGTVAIAAPAPRLRIRAVIFPYPPWTDAHRGRAESEM